MDRRPRAARIWSVALGVFAITALLSAQPASADHWWGGYHWARTGQPIRVSLGDNVPRGWDDYLRTAAGDWSKAEMLDTAVVRGGTTGTKCQPTWGRVEVCSASYGQNGWLGLATVWVYPDGEIVQGTAQMNDTYFKMAAYNNPSEKLHVMCQEVGHTFGLGHTSEDGSSQNTCMDYYYNRTNDGISTKPNAHDYEMLTSIYTQPASTTTASATSTPYPAGFRQAAGHRPAEWGRLVHAAGRGALYVRELPGGYTIATHVTWAEGHEPGGHQHGE